jgi:hypothetical protein
MLGKFRRTPSNTIACAARCSQSPKSAMTHRSFSRALSGPAIVLAVLGLSPRARADETYDIKNYPSLQNGYTLQGTITTDGKTGPITTADFTGESFQIYNSSGMVVYSETTGSLNLVESSDLVATASGLELSVLSADGFLEMASTIPGHSGLLYNTDAYAGFNGFVQTGVPGNGFWTNAWIDTENLLFPTMQAPDNPDSLLIATPEAASVSTPEPSRAVSLAGMGLLAVVGLLLRSRRGGVRR